MAHTTLTVGPRRVPCTGVAPRMCLRVRRSPSGPWETFFDEIDGFDHEPGYECDLVVDVTRRDGPPADGSSVRYRLLEVVGRRAVADD